MDVPEYIRHLTTLPQKMNIKDWKSASSWQCEGGCASTSEYDGGLHLSAIQCLRRGPGMPWLTRQINFVEHNNDLELVLQRQIHIGQGLRLHSLHAHCVSA